MDNLNIHSIASLYKAFDPAIARQVAQRLEIHHTPIHASWLNMAEIESRFFYCPLEIFYLSCNS